MSRGDDVCQVRARGFQGAVPDRSPDAIAARRGLLHRRRAGRWRAGPNAGPAPPARRWRSRAHQATHRARTRPTSSTGSSSGLRRLPDPARQPDGVALRQRPLRRASRPRSPGQLSWPTVSSIASGWTSRRFITRGCRAGRSAAACSRPTTMASGRERSSRTTSTTSCACWATGRTRRRRSSTARTPSSRATGSTSCATSSQTATTRPWQRLGVSREQLQGGALPDLWETRRATTSRCWAR